MGNLKCPWQTVKRTIPEKNGSSTTTVYFADCIKSQCPFWQEQQRIGYCNTIEEHCMRAKGEIRE